MKHGTYRGFYRALSRMSEKTHFHDLLFLSVAHLAKLHKITLNFGRGAIEMKYSSLYIRPYSVRPDSIANMREMQ